VVTALQEKKQAGALVAAWDKVALYPRRHPVLLYLLGKLYAEGEFDHAETRPDTVSVGRVLLTLARIIEADRKGNTLLNRVRSRIVSLLTGRQAFLERCLDHTDRDQLAAYLQIVERGGEDFPQEIVDVVLRAVSDKHPDLTSKPERPFWELEEAIWVTAEGLERQRAEYRILVDEKIPANSKAIGAAAALGDLSENSEWEAAMEEQRNLTTRAQDMDRQLRRARLLDDVEIPDGIVAPGTRVTFRFHDQGDVGSYRILGPWDCVEEDVINYRAPIAAAFLGKAVGEDGSFDEQGGGRTFRIESIERVI
jgi:transcription elongation factor GreA